MVGSTFEAIGRLSSSNSYCFCWVHNGIYSLANFIYWNCCNICFYGIILDYLCCTFSNWEHSVLCRCLYLEDVAYSLSTLSSFFFTWIIYYHTFSSIPSINCLFNLFIHWVYSSQAFSGWSKVTLVLKPLQESSLGFSSFGFGIMPPFWLLFDCVTWIGFWDMNYIGNTESNWTVEVWFRRI